MDLRVSDFDDILLLFMKMKKESFSRFGPRHQQKPFWRGFSSNISEQIQKLLGFNFCMTKHIVVLLIMDMKEAKSDVNGRKEKVCFCYFVLESAKKKTKKGFKNI